MMIIYLWIGYLLLTLFIFGSAVGSFLNVCIARLPRRMSLIQPGSHCFACGRAIPLRENIPLLSYWLLGGRCRRCGATFSSRYFLVELVTGIAFALIFFLEAGLNIHRLAPLGDAGFSHLQWGIFSRLSIFLVLYHCLLFSLLLVLAFCSWEYAWAPLSMVVFSLALGLLGAAWFAWPWPCPTDQALGATARSSLALRAEQPPLPGPPRGPMPVDSPWSAAPRSPRAGFYSWPVWGPLPRWLPPASWGLGLATGLAGVALGLTLVLVAPVRMSLADACLLAVAGAFLGWQTILVAYVVTLVLALPLDLLRPGSDSQIPWLSIVLPLTILAAWLGWPWISGWLSRALFHPLAPAGLGASILLLALARLLRGGQLTRPLVILTRPRPYQAGRAPTEEAMAEAAPETEEPAEVAPSSAVGGEPVGGELAGEQDDELFEQGAGG